MLQYRQSAAPRACVGGHGCCGARHRRFTAGRPSAAGQLRLPHAQGTPPSPAVVAPGSSAQARAWRHRQVVRGLSPGMWQRWHLCSSGVAGTVVQTAWPQQAVPASHETASCFCLPSGCVHNTVVLHDACLSMLALCRAQTFQLSSHSLQDAQHARQCSSMHALKPPKGSRTALLGVHFRLPGLQAWDGYTQLIKAVATA